MIRLQKLIDKLTKLLDEEGDMETEWHCGPVTDGPAFVVHPHPQIRHVNVLEIWIANEPKANPFTSSPFA